MFGNLKPVKFNENLPPKGVHKAVLHTIAYMGLYKDIFNNDETIGKVFLGFTLVDENGASYEISKEVKFSEFESSAMMECFIALHGSNEFSEEFSEKDLLGKTCELIVTKKVTEKFSKNKEGEKGQLLGNQTYAEIKAFSKCDNPLDIKHDTVYYNTAEKHDPAAFLKLPRWISKKINNERIGNEYPSDAANDDDTGKLKDIAA